MHRRHFLASLATAAATPAAGTVVLAQPAPRFEFLGALTVNFRADRDVIRLSPYEGSFRDIQLRVKRHAIEMLDLKIVYGNGQIDDVTVRHLIKASKATRVIDLIGSRRAIREIRMVYRTTPNFSGDPAVVEVWGLR